MSNPYLPFVYRNEKPEYQLQPRYFSDTGSSSSPSTSYSPYSAFENLGIGYTNSPSNMSDETPVENLTPDEANRIIHSHRKVRYGTACWPCRQRKVKCDNKQPCENCIKRDHANLCSYNPKQHQSKKPSGSQAGVKRARSPTSEGEGSVRKDEDRWPSTTDDVEPNESRYLGQNSIAAFLKEEAKAGEPSADSEHEVIRQDIMPILGLQISSAPYPFMSHEHMDKIRQDIAAALPQDREVLKTFQIYKQIVQPFWGLLIDIQDFETKLCLYLEDRSATSKHPATDGKGVSSAWLGMLFAVLAVATNYTELSCHKRAAISQAYVQSSFHCLRLSNFLIRPSLESLQALLILGFVLANDMKAEASWALLGLSCRLAQALGLHRGPNESSRNPAAPSTPTPNDLPRRRLWWTIVWQDSLLSLSFDRAPIAVTTRCAIPLSPTALTNGFSYTEAMYHLCANILSSVKNDSNVSHDYAQIMENSQKVENIRKQVKPEIRLKEGCKTVQDKLQYYAVRLHTSFVVSVLCRPALRRGECYGMDASQKALLAEKCKQNLTETVRMYLKMHSFSVIPTRSWAFTFHGLSSAVLLGILGETKADPEVRKLQGELIDALSVTAARDGEGKGEKGKDIELSGPLSRALDALRNIYNHGWVVDGNNCGPGDGQAQEQAGDQGQFEHQDAALAMASMQRNGMMPLDYPQTPYSMNMNDHSQQAQQQGTNGSESNLEMSPMDLFDSIFWDPYPMGVMGGAGGMDQMGFDYGPAMYPQFG